MIKSMTGFGRYELFEDNCRITVEIKAVNHRYLDLNFKMPKKLGTLEGNARSLLKKYAERGKVDVFLTFEDYSEQQESVRYNAELAREYLGYLNQMAEELQLENPIDTVRLSHYPDVFTMQETKVEPEILWNHLQKALCGAAEQFVASRIREGEHLRQDLLEKLDQMEKNVAYIEQRSPEVMQEYRNRLEEKVRELLGDTQMDESRIVTEVTLYADKICVDEETVRLRSHIESMRQTLLEGGSVGRKLDFIAQELNREANTVLSKVSDIAITDTAIELKTSIEKVREQIQNIE